MILTLDIGNTNIKTALFDGTEMVKYWRLSTSITNTSDEYGITIDMDQDIKTVGDFKARVDAKIK